MVFTAPPMSSKSKSAGHSSATIIQRPFGLPIKNSSGVLFETFSIYFESQGLDNLDPVDWIYYILAGWDRDFLNLSITRWIAGCQEDKCSFSFQ